jgi:hypothetical protein
MAVIPLMGAAASVVRPWRRGIVSNSVKWTVGAILAIVGILAIVVAVIYVSVPIHSLPGFIPGKRPVGGHYHKRALLVGVIGVVLLVISGLVGFTARGRVAATPAE